MKQLSEDVDIFKISKSWIPKIQNFQILKNEKIVSEKKSDRKKKSERFFFGSNIFSTDFFQIDFFQIEKISRSKKKI